MATDRGQRPHSATHKAPTVAAGNCAKWVLGVWAGTMEGDAMAI